MPINCTLIHYTNIDQQKATIIEFIQIAAFNFNKYKILFALANLYSNL